jgi:hypothetical protein
LSNIECLKSCKTLADLACLLGYQTKSLAYILYKIDEDQKYTPFTIPKKSGGERNILAPCERLKTLQKKLANLLYECVEELKPANEKLSAFLDDTSPNKLRAHKSISHGYEKGLSIISNAEVHLNKRYVFNIDLKDFFPAFNFGRVRGFLIKNRDFQLSPKVATVIAQIACHKNSLPQGSPCSPIISNLIAKRLDFKLLKLAKQFDCAYSRYVDDLTFSCSKKDFPTEIAIKRGWGLINNTWWAGKALEKNIMNEGFVINKKKCRMQANTSRQEVTGIVVNKKLNVPSSYYRSVRAMCNSVFHNGYYEIPTSYSLSTKHKRRKKRIFDKVFSIFNGKNKKKAKANKEKNTTTSLNKLNGMIVHVYKVRSYRNRFASVGYRLHKHDGIRTKNNNDKYPPLNRCESYRDESHQVALDGIKNLYQRFLFFKYFYMPTKPLIICEGKTDNIYLKSALDKLSGSYPLLGKRKGGEYGVTFFNRTATNNEMLSMAEGTSGLAYLVEIYQRLFKRFSCEGKKHPIIIVVDNDDAGRGVVSKGGKLKKNNPLMHKSYLYENLFVLTLPSTGKKDTSMEDYFDKSVLETKLNGKSFNPSNNKIDNSIEYSKDHFSRFVIIPNKSTINFSAFQPLFEELQSIVATYNVKNI